MRASHDIAVGSVLAANTNYANKNDVDSLDRKAG